MKKLIVALTLCAFAGAPFAAEDPAKFPSKPVTAMVAWAAGGGADLVFRALAEVFPKYANGQPLVIVNKGEAAGVPGIVDFMQNASADGYNVMHWNIAHVIKSHMDNVPFTATSFTPVAKVVEAPDYLNVKADAKWKNLQEFIADAKANPGQISIGNAGVGGGNHLAAILFEQTAGIKVKHIPFAGGGPSVTGLLSGDCQSAMNVAPEGIPNVQSGQVRILAVFGDKRFAAAPDAPTGKEAGLDFVYDQWRGVVAPPKTPAEIVARLQAIFKSCVEDPVYIEKMKKLGATPAFKDAKSFGELIASEDKRLENVIKTAKIGNRYK
ncbi:MAG: tripartite tricarboxylate transporter substrate binding protein [Candidatus Accumulibacter sp.]|jgi:tripartite-type tricarboxylate transporter receptor subunit TctC|nr:tripartite tricarboxylate transporter substrate binding protein [Accumulibacter sp.]